MREFFEWLTRKVENPNQIETNKKTTDDSKVQEIPANRPEKAKETSHPPPRQAKPLANNKEKKENDAYNLIAYGMIANNREKMENDACNLISPAKQPNYEMRPQLKPKRKNPPTYDEAMLTKARDDLWKKLSGWRRLRKLKRRQDLKPKTPKGRQLAVHLAKMNENTRPLYTIREEEDEES